jgi:hypothetical protein
MGTSSRSGSAPGPQSLPGWLVGGGGVLFALGNLLHPLEHNEAAHRAATWEAAHLTFALGGLMICAGLPWLLAAGRVVRDSWLPPIGGALVALAFAALGPGAWFEAFVAPLPGGVAEGLERGGGGTVNAVAGTAWIASMLLGIALIWHGTRRSVRGTGIALIVAVVTLLAGPAIPVAEGLWIIPASMLAGLAFTALSVAAARSPRTAPGRAGAAVPTGAV